jgi:3-oxoacyl-(acyl-carrier-protein) synthase
LTRRVVVTGIGMVSALGIGTDASWKGLLAGKSGVTRITRFDASAYAAQIAAEVQDFDPLQFVDKKDVKTMDVFIQYAVAASQFAMDDAKLAITAENAERSTAGSRAGSSAASRARAASRRTTRTSSARPSNWAMRSRAASGS